MSEERSLVTVSKTSFGQFKKFFESPIAMYERAVEYIQWCENNPLYISEQVRKPGSATIIPGIDGAEPTVIPPELLIEIPRKRAATREALSLFMGVGPHYYATFKQKLKTGEMRDTENEDWQKVTDVIDGMIFAYNYEGAAAGQFNPALTARYLGIAEKIESKSEVKTTKEVFRIGDTEIEF